MGTTANLGIEYPDPSGVPSRQTYVEDPIKSVDAKVVAYLRKHFKDGVDTATIAVGQSVSTGVAISFPTPFDSAPSVGVTARSSFGYTASIGSVSPAGVTVFIHRPAGAPTTSAANVTFDWRATDLGNS